MLDLWSSTSSPLVASRGKQCPALWYSVSYYTDAVPCYTGNKNISNILKLESLELSQRGDAVLSRFVMPEWCNIVLCLGRDGPYVMQAEGRICGSRAEGFIDSTLKSRTAQFGQREDGISVDFRFHKMNLAPHPSKWWNARLFHVLLIPLFYSPASPNAGCLGED